MSLAAMSAKVLKDVLKTTVVTGQNINTNIAVSGIVKGEDTLLRVIAIDGDGTLAVSVLDVTSEASITSDGNIQVTTTNLAAYRLIVEWWDKSAERAGVAD